MWARLVWRLTLALGLLFGAAGLGAAGYGAARYGDIIAYVSAGDIFVLDVESGRAYNLTRYPYPDNFPSWSPDGRQLAFISWRRGSNLYLIGADGRGLRRLVPNANVATSPPRWSSDGRFLAVQTFFPNPDTIALVDVQGGRWLADTEAPSWADFATRSPDGHSSLFSAIVGGNSDIFRADAHTPPRNLTQHRAWDDQPAWSPDGRRIAFISQRSGAADLYIMDADGGNVRRLTYTPSAEAYPTWRP